MSVNHSAGNSQAHMQGQNNFSQSQNTASTNHDVTRPANASSGALPFTTPQNGQPVKRLVKKKAPANPLVASRRPTHKSTKPPPKPGAAVSKPPMVTRPTVAQAPLLEKPILSAPIFTVPRSQLDGLRHHVMKLHPPAAKKNADLYDESEFTPPLRLHRRDPRAPVGAAPNAEIVEEKDNIEDDKERERLEIIKEERRRVREENQAQIAPSLKKSRPQAFQKKTEQVYRKDDTPEARKKQQLRYEEALPWHLEDFDNKNSWVGAYEAALSDHFVMLVRDQQGFRMVPVEKWYRFTSKARGKTFTAEEAEAAFQSKTRAPRWFVESEKKYEAEREKKRDTALAKRIGGSVFVNNGDQPRRKGNDGDDIDYNFEEDFADDEEGVNGLFEGEDEDTKATTEKIKKEQLAANIFDMRDEKDVWNEEDEEKRKEEETKKFEKEMRKALLKREKNLDYDVDSEGNPYSSSSESIDSEEERRRDEEAKKEEAQKAKQEAKETDKAKQAVSGTSSKGTTTPSGRGKTINSLKLPSKRPGSPNLSEASGNESSRKKHKKKHPSSQAGQPTNKLTSRIKGGAGSGSESEGGHRYKLKMSNRGSPAGTPGASRAASPVAGGNSPTIGATNTSKGSPTASGTSTPVPATVQGMPTPEELLAAVPPTGLPMGDLLNLFRSRFRDDKSGFIQLVKSVLRLDRDTKKLFRK